MPEMEFQCTGPIDVSARLAAGALEVVAEADRTVATVQIEPYDGSDDGRVAAERTRVDFRSGALRIEAPEAGGRRWLGRRSSAIRVRAWVPAGSVVDARSASADIGCSGGYASAVVKTASGRCALQMASGDVLVDAASGGVRLGAIGGALRVRTASGDVSVDRVDGDARVDTASGNVEFGAVGAGLRVTTASGTVRVGAARRGTVRLDSASGQVSVGVTAGTGVWLDLQTLTGSTNSDLQHGGEAPPTGHDLTLKVRTVSGDIDVRRVPADDADPIRSTDDTATEEATQ